MNVTVTRGHYNFADPGEERILVSIELPGFDRLSITLPVENNEDLHDPSLPWSGLAREACARFLSTVLWSSNLELCRCIASWLEDEQNAARLDLVWVDRSIESRTRKAEQLQQEIAHLRDMRETFLHALAEEATADG